MAEHYSNTHNTSCFGPSLLMKGMKSVCKRLVRRARKEGHGMGAQLSPSLHFLSRCKLIEVLPAEAKNIWMPRHQEVLRRLCPLPVDVWGVVTEYLTSDVLTQVNGTFYQLLPRRHLNILVTGDNIQNVAAMYAGDVTIREMAISCKSLNDTKGQMLSMAGQLPALEALSVQLYLHQFRNEMTDHTIQALADIRNCQSLRHLELDLHCSVGGRGAGRLTHVATEALAGLANSTTLVTLMLDLAWNHIGPRGVEALMKLKTLPNLRSLELNFTSAGIGDAGAMALAQLSAAPALHTLQLDLSGSGIKDAGLSALGAVCQAPALRCLGLDLSCTQIGDSGLDHFLHALSEAPLIETLALDVTCTSVTENGLKSITALRHAPALKELTLVLGRLATDAVATAIASLGHAPRLLSLSVDMDYSTIGDEGALALAGLRKAQALEALRLDLSRTIIGDTGAKYLTALRECPTLDTLSLDLTGTRVRRAGRLALQALRCAHFWSELALLTGPDSHNCAVDLADITPGRSPMVPPFRWR